MKGMRVLLVHRYHINELLKLFIIYWNLRFNVATNESLLSDVSLHFRASMFVDLMDTHVIV